MIYHHHPHGPSKLYLRYLCPGSYQMEESAKAKGLDLEVTPEEASEGTLIHSKLDPGTSIETLTDEQQRLVLKAREFIASKIDGSQHPSCQYERTMALWGDTPDPLTFGTADFVAVLPQKVVIIEIKTGWNPLEVEALTWQTRAYAAMAMGEFLRYSAEVWVYNPRTGEEWFGAVQDRVWIREQIKGIIERVNANPEERHPSPAACRHCKGKAICPEYKAELEALPAIATVDSLPATTIGALLDKCSTIDGMVEALRAKAREMLAAGVEVPGWELGSRKRRTITSAQRAYDEVQYELTQDEFLELVTVPIGPLEDAVARRLTERIKMTLAKAKEVVNQRLTPAIEERLETFLRRKKE